eukprot:Gb_11697 [translate_table: standard]
MAEAQAERANNNIPAVEAVADNEKAMAAESGGKEKKWAEVLDIVARALTIGATLAAAIVMGTNNQTKSIPVAIVNNVPVTVPITAKYHYTPAFEFFVVANGIACGYGVLSLLLSVAHIVSKFGPSKNFSKFVLSFLDLVTVALLSAGASAAAAIAEVGRKGNSHSRWNKICDKYGRFCHHGGGAILASFIGVALFMLLSASSSYRMIYKRRIY